MDLTSFLAALENTVGSYLPKIAGALGILAVGWLVAVIARAGTRKLLSALKVDRRIAESTQQATQVESIIAGGLFWLILLVTAVGVFNVLNLNAVSNPFSLLVTRIINYLPNLIGGATLALIAWLIASLLRSVVDKALRASKLDDKLSESAGMRPMSAYLGDVLFWLVHSGGARRIRPERSPRACAEHDRQAAGDRAESFRCRGDRACRLDSRENPARPRRAEVIHYFA